MRIIIEFDDQSVDNIIFDNVYQFALCGSLLQQNMFSESFRRSMISDPNELIGLLKTTQLDILDHKKDVADVDTSKR